MANRKVKPAESDDARRNYLSQTDVPAYGLTQAIKVAQAIADNYGKSPTKPLRVAQAMNLQPASSYFRMTCGSSIAYGLTDGGAKSELIAITPLGRRIISPTKEGDDLAAKREALQRPRVVRDFLTRYNGSKIPIPQIARNILEELGVPHDRSEEVFSLIVESAREVGFLREVKGQLYVDLEAANEQSDGGDINTLTPTAIPLDKLPTDDPEVSPATLPRGNTRPISRVFITHGKNTEIVAQLKDVLTFGGFTPVIALENETVSKPVSDKVMDDMRSCAAAIIHVGSEQRLIDTEGREQKMLNQNVLIEIGAAMALYGRKFILLVEKDVMLPSNLQGLYEVRYTGGKLDYEATMKLLKAFNDLRS